MLAMFRPLMRRASLPNLGAEVINSKARDLENMAEPTLPWVTGRVETHRARA